MAEAIESKVLEVHVNLVSVRCTAHRRTEKLPFFLAK